MPDERSSRNRAEESAHIPMAKASFRRIRFVDLGVAERVGTQFGQGRRVICTSDSLHDAIDHFLLLRAAENLVHGCASRQVFMGTRFVEQQGYGPQVALGGSIDQAFGEDLSFRYPLAPAVLGNGDACAQLVLDRSAKILGALRPTCRVARLTRLELRIRGWLCIADREGRLARLSHGA